jgi:hypothetical protein
MLRLLFHILLILLLTILTQIGGVIYLLSILFIKKSIFKYRLKRMLLFSGLYLLSTFLIVPYLAPFFGRQKIENNYRIQNQSFFTILCNRNYVTPELHEMLVDTSLHLNKWFPNTQLVYLDANFPFFDGFPLLPHLSHNDGKKIDLSFVYNDANGEPTNEKPSNTGYGVFENPRLGEINQTQICKDNGGWQYDFPKYLTLGSTDELTVNTDQTKKLIQLVAQHPKVKKIFLEPHLKKRWQLNSNKIRFHGCKAVRHDDHIHVELN